MKKAYILLFFISLSSITSYGQLLTKPSLTVKDFEKSLTNVDHLRKILKRHKFEYYNLGETKPGYINELNSSSPIINPLLPDIRSFKSEDWMLKNQRNQLVFRVSIYEWEPNHAPQPEDIKTIRVMINRRSIYGDRMESFLEKIKDKYPNKSKRYFRNDDFYKQFGNPLIVFTNDSKVEVRTESDGAFYTVNFDLTK